MCMMMAADGDISQQELGQLQEIGKELDEHFPEYQGKVVEECTALVEKLDAENYQEEKPRTSSFFRTAWETA